MERQGEGAGRRGRASRWSLARWRESLFVRALDLPEDVALDLPRVTILGGMQVTVENHRGIVSYDPCRVVVGMNGGRILITGEDLVLGCVQAEEISVTGLVAAVAFQRVG